MRGLNYYRPLIIGFIGLILFFGFSVQAVFGQEQDSIVTDSIKVIQQNVDDSIQEAAKRAPSVVDVIKGLALVSQAKSNAKYQADRIAAQKNNIIAELRNTSRRLTMALARGFDSADLDRDIQKIESLRKVAGDGIFENEGTAQTTRNLEASKVFLNELLEDVEQKRQSMRSYLNELSVYRSTIDSLASDSAIFVIPDDSSEAVEYLIRLRVLNMEVGPVDSALTLASKTMQRDLGKINFLRYALQNDIKQIDDYRKAISISSAKREFSNIWGEVGFVRPFGEIISFSAKKGVFVLRYYAMAHKGKILLSIFMVLLLTRFLFNIKRNVLKEFPLTDFSKDKVVLRYPLFSAIFITINVFQFFYPDPPFVFYGGGWVLAGLALTIILNGYIQPYWNRVWMVLYLLFVLACLDNNILQASRTERWFIQVLSMAGVIIVSIVLFGGQRKTMREKRILLFIGIMGVLHVIAFVANIYGRYNIAKVQMTAGYFNMAVGVMLLWTVRFINDVFQYSSDTLKQAYNKVFYVDFTKINRTVPKYIYGLLGIGWFALMARNFYFYSVLMNGINDFLTFERQIGKYTFTIGSLFTFIVVLVVAGIASKVVSFFASDSSQQRADNDEDNKAGWGSWLLLVRIGIITVGVLLALAAAGIPLDRITIIIGALGVGIGLGLQAIVNNLVSGLIIAFEKPIAVGDVVEVGKQSGIMKSIGFRSSVVTTWDGADVIIPNGDLLNQHLINWTGQTKTRRVEVLVGVAYGTDLAFVQQKLMDMLMADDRILKSPSPVVLVTNFGNSSIDFRILFWVANYATWLAVKSDVILRVDRLFKENNITIPFPQQDIHIKVADGKNLETGAKGHQGSSASELPPELPPLETPG